MTTLRALQRAATWIVVGFCVSCGVAERVDEVEGGAQAPQAVTRTNVCPQFEWWLMLPKSMPVGETTEIIVNVSDADTPLSNLMLDWRAPSGRFSDPDLSATAYTCEQSGRQVLTFSARDDQGCTSELQLDVQCFDAP